MFANPYAITPGNIVEMKISSWNIKSRWRKVQLWQGNDIKDVYLKYTGSKKQQQLSNMVSLPLHSISAFTVGSIWKALYYVKHCSQCSVY